MGVLKIDSLVGQILKDFQCPEDIAFGKVMAPVMVWATYYKGQWEELRLLPYKKLELDPTAKVLHYGQEIFEGMKAYANSEDGPFLFRPEDNFERFNASARRMAMPEVPREYFMEGVEGIAAACADFIPRTVGDSLYIRPFMFASEEHLGIAPSGRFEFLIVASPSRDFFTGASLSVKLERQHVRAVSGGVGCAKTGGNYAASLFSMIQAKREGHDQVLWLDAQERKYIEELSGMNFFAIYGKKMKTPQLTDTILDGITRKSMITLGTHLGYAVEEVPLPVEELIRDIQAGDCTELFACGTAVIVAPIKTLSEGGRDYHLKEGAHHPVAKELKEHLLGLQQGTNDDPFGWRQKVSLELQV